LEFAIAIASLFYGPFNDPPTLRAIMRSQFVAWLLFAPLVLGEISGLLAVLHRSTRTRLAWISFSIFSAYWLLLTTSDLLSR
jgi:hypothetical protein